MEENYLKLYKEVAEMKSLLLIAIDKMAVRGGKMTQREYAAYRRVSQNTIIQQIKKHLYDTPQGFTEPAFDNTGKRGSAMFVRELADLYYSINIKKCPEASDMAEHTL